MVLLFMVVNIILMGSLSGKKNVITALVLGVVVDVAGVHDTVVVHVVVVVMVVVVVVVMAVIE